MKKTLLSVIAGLAVINAASAVPSPADRKALCEKHPEKYVWVEKTQACVPIDPCNSDNVTIKETYCIETKDIYFPENQLDLVLSRYAEKVLKTTLLGKQILKDGKVAMVTSDGGYAVVDIEDYTDYSDVTRKYRSTLADIVAAWAYGYILDLSVNIDEIEDDVFVHTDRIIGNISKTECDDIRDFASLIGEHYLFDSEYNDGECLIKYTIGVRK